MPLVGYVVTELITRLPAHVRREDLESAGYEALVRCARSLRPERRHVLRPVRPDPGPRRRVDELRSADWASRGTRRAERRLAGAEDRLTQQLGRQPSPAELAADLGEDGTDLVRTRERVQRAAVLSLNALVGDSDVDLATNLPRRTSARRSGSSPASGTRCCTPPSRRCPSGCASRRHRVLPRREADGRDRRASWASASPAISQMRAQALELLREGMNRAPRGRRQPAPAPPSAEASPPAAARSTTPGSPHWPASRRAGPTRPPAATRAGRDARHVLGPAPEHHPIAAAKSPQPHAGDDDE